MGRFYWAVGPEGFNLKERRMRNGERYNGTLSNATDVGFVWVRCGGSVDRDDVRV